MTRISESRISWTDESGSWVTVRLSCSAWCWSEEPGLVAGKEWMDLKLDPDWRLEQRLGSLHWLEKVWVELRSFWWFGSMPQCGVFSVSYQKKSNWKIANQADPEPTVIHWRQSSWFTDLTGPRISGPPGGAGGRNWEGFLDNLAQLGATDKDSDTCVQCGVWFWLLIWEKLNFRKSALTRARLGEEVWQVLPPAHHPLEFF